jgi:hypothetical protein
MKRADDFIEDETTMTEITVQPDGRIFVFGTSRQVLDLLVGLNPRSSKLNRLIRHVRSVESTQRETRETESKTSTSRSN